MGFGKYIPALIDGSSAADGSTIAHSGGKVHNRAEADWTQTDLDIVDKVYIEYTDGFPGTSNAAWFTKTGEQNGRGVYTNTTYELSHNGTTWRFVIPTYDTWTYAPASTQTFPDKTGWPASSTNAHPPITISYGDFWVDSGEYVDVGITEFDAHVNGDDGVWLKWEKLGSGSVCHVVEAIKYSESWTPTLSEYNKLLKWSNNYLGCGNGVIEPLRDVNGDIIYDVSGEVIYTL